jgi:ABC-type uncharacterized transport system ATPase subunit
LASRVVVLRAGSIVADGTVEQLIAQSGRGRSLADALELLFFPQTADHVADYFQDTRRFQDTSR